jgi:branched-chain amino acid transport system permease protein
MRTNGIAGARELLGSNSTALRMLAPWIVSVSFLLLLPVVFSSGSALTIMNQMAITIVFALSYNMLLGQGGMLSFGHAAYMGLGGFFCMHLMNIIGAHRLFIPLPILPLFGGVFGLLFAIIIGSFSTRRAGTVFAMISLGVGELVASCSIIIVIFFGGEEGVSGDRTVGPAIFGVNLVSQLQVYYLTAVWLVISVAAMFLYTRTPIGRITNAVRDNEERAEFVGYSQRYVRFISFCWSGFFAGIAGGLFAINFEILTEENLNLVTSGTILLVTFLGGVGFFIGPIIGAVVFTLLQTVLSLYTEIWQLYLGALFLLAVMFFPSGLTGLLAMHQRARQLGKLKLLVVPYVKLFALGSVTLLSIVAVLEIAFHARHAAEGDEAMKLYWMTFDSHGVLAWTISLGVSILGSWLIIQLAPQVKAAWDAANQIETER